ncbi:MAG: hypothetical protein IPM24_03310 [Bryobacterales bacterium]|nr:hypothetical protein [Bryobacterales bacterium]
MFACLVGPGAAGIDWLEEFTPRYERAGEDAVVLDLAGMGRVLGAPAEIARRLAERAGGGVRVAVAAHRDAALYAARGFAGVTVLAPGEEASRLGPLPVELLDPPAELLETLDRWGIRTLRDLAALPATGVAERLGAAGVRLWKLARGEGLSPFRPEAEEARCAASLELDHPIDALEPLSFVLSRLLRDLHDRLEQRALAVLSLRVSLQLDAAPVHERTLRLPVPLRDPLTLLKLLQLDLTAHPPTAAVLAVEMEAEPAPPRPAQHGLFLPPSPEPERLELTLARLAALVGEGNVGAAELLDTHRPGAYRTVPFTAGAGGEAHPRRPRLVFRTFRPPRPVRVVCADGVPEAVLSRGARQEIAATAGPWRTSGDWWRGNAWARDDWDVAFADGTLHRLSQRSGRWFLAGRYD